MSTKTHYVYSTLSSTMNYENSSPGGADLPVPTGNVVIYGGSNIPDKYMRTPVGVVTPVTDEELTILEANAVFQLHKKNGFIVVKDKKHDAEKVAADMVTRDSSAPLVDADFETPPVTPAADDTDKPPAPKSNGRRA